MRLLPEESMPPLARRGFLLASLGAAFLPGGRARAEEERYAWQAPPLGLRWSTRGAVLWSDGQRYSYDYENRVEAVEGDLVTYLESTRNLVDDMAWQTRIQSFRFWETRWEQPFAEGEGAEGEGIDREALGSYDPERLKGFWPWEIGTTLSRKTPDNADLYQLEAFEDLSDLQGVTRRVARFSYLSGGDVPGKATLWCDVAHGPILRLVGSDGYLDDAGEAVTRKVELDLIGWQES